MKSLLNSFLLLQLFYIRHVYSIMSLTCLQTLNTSDCNETPTRVFSYYKPGSRCEVEVWRGCPTGNKFDTEEECSETCIYKTVEFEKKVRHQLNAKCIIPEDLNNCQTNVIHGFKYDKILLDCVEVDTNCPGHIFIEKLECIQSCVRDLSWDEKMKLVSSQQSKELDSILESFSNSTDEETSETKTTDSVELKITTVGETDVNVKNNTAPVKLDVHSGEVVPAEDVEEQKLKGEDSNTTQSYEKKETGGNSTSANNATATIGTGVTGVTTDNNAISINNTESVKNNTDNVQNNTESVKETTNQNIITTTIKKVTVSENMNQ